MNKKYLTALAFITLANVTNATAVSSDSAPESLDSIISAEFHRRSELISSESNGFIVFQGEFNAEKKRIDAQSLSAKFKQAQATVEEQKSQLQRRPSVAEALDSGYTGDITEIGEATRRMHERKNFLQEIFHNVSNKVKSDPFLSKNLDIIRTLADLEISNSCCYLILLPKVSINDIYLAIDHIVDDASKKGFDLTTEEFFWTSYQRSKMEMLRFTTVVLHENAAQRLFMSSTHNVGSKTLRYSSQNEKIVH